MGLSLKKLGDQLNPFDGGRSYHTQTTNADRAKLANQQLNQARQQSLQKAASMGNVQSQNKLKTNNYQIKYQAPPSFRQNIENATGTVGLGLGRSVVGTGQGLLGFYDLATTGAGTNRYTQALNRKAERLDQIQKDQGRSEAGYKAGQFFGDALTFLGGGAAIKGTTTGLVKGTNLVATKSPMIAKGLQVTKPVVNIVGKPGRIIGQTADDVIGKIAQKGATGRITATALKEAKLPYNIAETMADTGIGLGQISARGQKVTPQDVAIQAGLSTAFNVGLPATAQSVKEVFKMPSRMAPAVQGLDANALKKASKTGLIGDIKTNKKVIEAEIKDRLAKEAMERTKSLQGEQILKQAQKFDDIGGKNYLNPAKDNEVQSLVAQIDRYAKAADAETNPILKKQILQGQSDLYQKLRDRVSLLQSKAGTSLGSGPVAGYDAINNAKARNAAKSAQDAMGADTAKAPKTEGVAPTGKTERLYHGTNKDFKQFGIDDTTREVRKARQQLLDERNKLVDTGKVENGALSIPKKAQDRINAIDKEVATLDSRTDILPASVKEKGVYFTTDKKYAKTFAGKDGKIVEADVELNNPYIIKSKDEMDLIEDAAYYPKIIDNLEKQGYDGIKAPDGQVLVFDPQKAKLAQPTPPKGVAPKSAPVSYAQPNIRAKDIEVGDNLEIRDYGTKINQYNKEPAKNTTGKVVKIERNKEGESIYGGKIRGAVTYMPEGQTTLVHLEMPNGEIKIVKASEMGRDIWLGKNMEKGFAPEKLPVVNKQTAALSEEAAKEIDNIKTTADMFQNGKLNETQKKRIAELQDQAESSALSPQEEIQRIHNMAYRRGDKYTMTEERRLAELQEQINNSQPVEKKSIDMTVDGWVQKGYTKEQAERTVTTKQTTKKLNDEYAGKKYNEGRNSEIVSDEDLRTDKSKSGQRIIKSVQGYKEYTDPSGNKQIRLKVNTATVDHTPDSLNNRITELEKQKTFYDGELAPDLEKELQGLYSQKNNSTTPVSAPIEKTPLPIDTDGIRQMIKSNDAGDAGVLDTYFASPKLKQIFSDVLDTPVMVVDKDLFPKIDGGEKLASYLPERNLILIKGGSKQSADMINDSLLEEALHALRNKRGRLDLTNKSTVGKADDLARYVEDNDELVAKKAKQQIYENIIFPELKARQSSAPIEKTPTLQDALEGKSTKPTVKVAEPAPKPVAKPVVKTAPAPKPKVTVKKTVETPPPTKKPNVAQSNKPEVSFVERQAQAQADKEAQILKPRGVEAVRSRGRDVSSKLYNPYSEAERLNQLNAKSQGLSITGATKKLNASDDLASQMDFVANSRVAAKQLMEDTGLDKVIQKYPDKKGKVNEFVLYLAAKRDVAVSGAKGKRIYGGETLEDVNKFITDFETRNPQARTDLEAVKGSFRKLLDDELAAGTITPEFHKNALATEDYYAPIERVLGSDEVLRPSVNVNNRASLSRTSATRKLEGSADPVKGDWDAIIGGMQRRVRETKLNQAYGVMYDIAKNKRVDDSVRMGMTKEQSKSLIDLQDTIASLQKQAQAAKGVAKSAGKKARVASKKMTAYQNKVNDKAIERIAKNLEVNDVDGAAALRSLKRSDKNQLMSWLQGNMTDAEVTNGIKKSAQLQDAVARLQEARAIADDLQTTGTLFKGARSELIQATDARGRQVIRGFVDGYPTWLEVTPEIAKMVQGLEPQKLPGLIKGLSSLQRVWRTFWTGAYNPVFAVKSFLLYDPPMAAINQSGSRFQLDPRVAGKAIADTFTDYDGFFKELKRTGVQPVYGSKMSGDIKLDAKVIASHKNFQSRLAHLATHPGQLIEALDVIGGKLAHSTRMRTARAEYAKSISQGLSKNVALENAARAYNNVLPNYARTTRLMKEIDAIIPYASAGVAGNRALTTAMRTDPAGWAVKAGLFATAIAATGEYALGSDETKEFYQDMYDSDKVSVLQNNIVFALPGAKKNPDTGEWSGIVKIAIPPEFRAPNAILQQALADNNEVDTGNYDPRLAATTSVATAGITNIGRSGDINAEYNPAIQAGLELSTNKRGGTGDSFAYGDTQYLNRNDQINDNTSQLAVSGAQAFNKLPVGDISPAALDEQLKSLGMGGNVIRSAGSSLVANEDTPAERLPGTGLDKTIKGLYSADGTKGMTETGWHFKHQDQVMNELPSKVLRDQFSIVNSKNDSPGDAQAKSQLLYESLQSDGALWDAQKKQNDLDATKTGISNPLFGLTPEQARAVTLYRGNARMTAAKQTYAKDGSSLFESLGLDEEWYQDFKKQEDEFYKKLESKKKDSNSASVATTAKTYSGNPYQEPSRVIQSKLDVYYTLPKGTGARSAFLKENPDVVQYWDQQNGLANEERIAMGLDLLGTEGGKYSGYGYGSGGGGGGGGSSTASLNALKYALPLSAGGKFKSPVASKGKAVKVGVKRKDTTAKPKVSIKKSLV